MKPFVYLEAKITQLLSPDTRPPKTKKDFIEETIKESEKNPNLYFVILEKFNMPITIITSNELTDKNFSYALTPYIRALNNGGYDIIAIIHDGKQVYPLTESKISHLLTPEYLSPEEQHAQEVREMSDYLYNVLHDAAHRRETYLHFSLLHSHIHNYNEVERLKRLLPDNEILKNALKVSRENDRTYIQLSVADGKSILKELVAMEPKD